MVNFISLRYLFKKPLPLDYDTYIASDVCMVLNDR